MTSGRAKTVQEHIELARKFLRDSEQEFDSGDELQGSEKLWGATSQAVTAVAKRRGWRFGKSNHRAHVVDRLVEEYNDTSLDAEFSVAEKFHANFYHDFMEDYEIVRDRPTVSRFVHRMIEIAETE